MSRDATDAPFDDAAADYDRSFTDTEIGRALRGSVWRRYDEHLGVGSKVLELGCGTGEDALWLARGGHRVTATDVSRVMLDTAWSKIETAGLGDRVQFARLDLAAVDDAPDGAPFDAVVSNFGAVNCVEDRRALGAALYRWLRPGGVIVLVVMGPVCLWEIGWYLTRLRPRTATRRWRDGREAGVGEGRTVRVWYPGPRRLQRELERWFRIREIVGIGAVVPPVFARSVVRGRPRLLDRLTRLDERWASPLAGVADHYLLAAQRRDDAS